MRITNVKRGRATHLTVVAVTALALSALVSIDGAASANTAGDTITPASSLAKGLVDRRVATIDSPTDIAFTPDGRALITSDTGRLRVLTTDGLKRRAAVNLSRRLCNGGERGLLGVAVDPNFSRNHLIYLFWTFNQNDVCGVAPDPTPVNRVTRFKLGDNNRVVPGSARVIIDNIPSPAANHNGGDLAFGADSLLYASTGDGGCEIGAPDECGALNDNSRRLDIPLGKVLRVTRGGAVPSANPFVGSPEARRCTGLGGPHPGTGPCLETFAYGFRNPFRMAIRGSASTPWVNDVGQSTWEEIDRVTAGADYGWNIREGFCLAGSTVDCTPSLFTDPEFAYDHTTDCRSITGGAFVPKGIWGGRFAGDYVFADFTCGSLWRLHRSADDEFVAKPLAPASGPAALTFGPSNRGRALYYAEFSTGEIHRITNS